METRAGDDGGRLQWGDGGGLRTRREMVRVPGLEKRVRVAWVSDVHLARRTGVRTVWAVVRAVRRARPDAIVLGGDLIDGRRGERQLGLMIRALVRVAPVWALPGNHDERYGVERVKTVVALAGADWLPDGAARVAGVVALVMNDDERAVGPKGIVVACQHAPAGAERWAGRARVVLAGHLHGGQIAVANWGGRSWPCALFFSWCGPRFEIGGTTLLVGRGAGDQVPLRWRCPRELLCVDLVGA